jgi:F-type H+-transporting ATPase subunit b
MNFDPWTLGFQAVNVLVLVWLLHRFFWTPVAAMIAERQARSATLLGEAEATRAEADAALADLEATRAAIAVERDALLDAARKDAEAASAALIDAARAEAAALHDTAKAARVSAAVALKAAALEDAQGLALTIAGKLAARLDGAAIDAAFQGWLVKGIAELTDADRKALSGASLEVVSATPQDAAAQDRIAAALSAALGEPAKLSFRTDPALIAGHELHSPHFTLRNSWAADLDRVAAALRTADPEQKAGVTSDAA